MHGQSRRHGCRWTYKIDYPVMRGTGGKSKWHEADSDTRQVRTDDRPVGPHAVDHAKGQTTTTANIRLTTCIHPSKIVPAVSSCVNVKLRLEKLCFSNRSFMLWNAVGTFIQELQISSNI